MSVVPSSACIVRSLRVEAAVSVVAKVGWPQEGLCGCEGARGRQSAGVPTHSSPWLKAACRRSDTAPQAMLAVPEQQPLMK